MEMLLKYGYKGEYMSEDWLKQPLFIQSFAPTSLIYISNMTNSPKLFLIDDTTIPTQDTNQVVSLVRTDVFMHVSTHVMWLQFISLHLRSVPIVQSYYEITSNSYLEFIRNYVVGIGPWKDTIVPPNPKDNCLGQPTDLVAQAHALNLQVTD